MRGSGGQRRIAFATAGFAGISAIVAVVVWRVWGEETVGAVAGVVSMVAGVAALVLAWAALRGAGGLAERTPAGMADEIAKAVRSRWKAEIKLWRLHDPYTIPLRWEAADPSLFADWPAVELAARSAGWPERDQSRRWALGAAELVGGGDDIAGVLEKVPTGRLVVLGEPGAGKTILAVRLVLDLLTRRASGGPVPVLLPLASWNPASEDLWKWLEARMCLDLPALRAPTPGEKVSWARTLWDAGLLLPVLDGLDEIAEPIQGRAIAQLNEELPPGVGLVFTARTSFYRGAVQPGGGAPGVMLSGAAGIELCPLNAGTVTAYLLDSAGGPGGQARWIHVLSALADSSHPVGQALVTPLMATLARTIYNPRPDEPIAGLPHPDDMLGPELDSRTAVERHLFDGFLPAAYRPHPDPARSCPWKSTDAQRWLAFLASHLENRLSFTTDLAWWELHTAVPDSIRRIVLVLAAVPTIVGTVGLPVGLVAGLVAGLASGSAPGSGLPVGLAVVLAEILLVGVGVGSLGLGLRDGLTLGLMFGLFYGLLFGPPTGLAAGLAAELASGLGAGRAIGLGVGLGAGLAVGLPYVFVLGLHEETLDRFITAPMGLGDAAHPRIALVRDRGLFLVILLVLGFGSGLLGGLVGVLTFGLMGGLTFGFMFGFAFGLTMALLTTGWGWFAVARCWLALRGRLPWRLMAFLVDAHQQRGVLRQAGPVYQFRHVELQRHIARQS